MGKFIDNDGAQLIAELLGTNLNSLSTELEKLVLYVGDKKEITDHDVATMVGNITIVDNFKMVNLLSNKQSSKAMYMLLQVLNSNQERPEMLLGLLKWQFKRLYSIKKSLSEGISLTTIFF